jgi:basic amino acid/polyamine antiporter, APA family
MTVPRRKTMVVMYDRGDHADMVLKTASWLEHSGKFKVIILSVKRKDETPNETKPEKEQHLQYLEQIGIEFTEVYISDATEVRVRFLSVQFT